MSASVGGWRSRVPSSEHVSVFLSLVAYWDMDYSSQALSQSVSVFDVRKDGLTCDTLATCTCSEVYQYLFHVHPSKRAPVRLAVVNDGDLQQLAVPVL